MQPMGLVEFSNGVCGGNRCRNRGNGTNAGIRDFRATCRNLGRLDNEVPSSHLLSDKRRDTVPKGSSLGIKIGFLRTERRLVFLQKTLFSKRKDAVSGDDEMIDNPHIHHR